MYLLTKCFLLLLFAVVSLIKKVSLLYFKAYTITQWFGKRNTFLMEMQIKYIIILLTPLHRVIL